MMAQSKGDFVVTEEEMVYGALWVAGVVVICFLLDRWICKKKGVK